MDASDQCWIVPSMGSSISSTPVVSSRLLVEDTRIEPPSDISSAHTVVDKASEYSRQTRMDVWIWIVYLGSTTAPITTSDAE